MTLETRFRPSLVYLIMQGSASLFFSLVFTVNLIYQVSTVGLNPLQLVLVGTTLEITYFLFEIPTGVIADLYSRRWSVIFGYTLLGMGFLIEGSMPLFWIILIAQVVAGIGHTLISGAADAWIADEIGEAAAAPLFLRASQWALIGSLVGIGLSVGIAMTSLRLSILIGGALMLALAAFLIVVMDENGFAPTPAEERSSWQQMGHTLGTAAGLIRVNPILLGLMAMSLSYGLYSEGVDRLWTPHLLNNFLLPGAGSVEPVIWFGAIRAVGIGLALIAVEWLRRRIDTSSSKALAGAVFVLTAIVCAATAAFALSTNFWLAIGALLSFRVAAQCTHPLLLAWINHQVGPATRATVLSAHGQMNALGQIGGGPAVGWIGTLYGLRVALATSALILATALPVGWRLFRRQDAGLPLPEDKVALMN